MATDEILFADELPSWLLTILVLTAIIIVVSNTIVIIAIFKDRKLNRNVSNYFIASLAKDDLIAGLIVIPFGIIYEIESAAARTNSVQAAFNRNQTIGLNISTATVLEPGSDSVLSELFCDLFQISITGQGYSSTWHLCIIAMDRYYRITKPVIHKHWMTKKVICTLSIFIDILAAAFAIFFQSLSINHRSSGKYNISDLVNGGFVEQRKSCIYYTPTIQSMVPAYTIGLIPLTFMFYFYYQLFKLTRSINTTRNNQQLGTASSNNSSKNLSSNLSANQSAKNNHDPKPGNLKSILKPYPRTELNGTDLPKHQRTKLTNCGQTSATSTTLIVRYHPEVNQSKASLMIGLIIITYCLCVFPSAIVYILYYFCKSCESIVHSSPVVYMYPWLCTLNSAIDPFIFALMTKDMRRFVARLFCRRARDDNHLYS